jgi:hypothetical protein
MKEEYRYYPEKFINEVVLKDNKLPFKLRSFQEELIKELLFKNGNHIILQGRQLGISKLYEFLFLYLIIFESEEHSLRYKNINFLKHNFINFNVIVKNIHQYLMNLPTEYFDKDYLIMNERAIYYKDIVINFCTYQDVLENVDKLRNSLTIVDDAAFNNNLPDIYLQRVLMRKLIISSVPHGKTGMGKCFYELFSKEDTPFHKHTVHWTQIPEFAKDGKYYDTMTKSLQGDLRRINSELNLIFND